MRTCGDLGGRAGDKERISRLAPGSFRVHEHRLRAIAKAQGPGEGPGLDA